MEYFRSDDSCDREYFCDKTCRICGKMVFDATKAKLACKERKRQGDILDFNYKNKIELYKQTNG